MESTRLYFDRFETDGEISRIAEKLKSQPGDEIQHVCVDYREKQITISVEQGAPNFKTLTCGDVSKTIPF